MFLKRFLLFADSEALWTNLLANAVLVISGGLSFVVTLLFLVRTAGMPVRAPATCDWILVPGHALDHGAPSREFKVRLLRAARLFKRFPHARLLVLGGRSPGSERSEAQAGLEYLSQHQGIDVGCDQILAEDQSRHTLENFQSALRCLAIDKNDGKREAATLLVTSRYHMARALLMARNLGIPATPYPAEIKWRFSARQAVLILWEAYLVHWYFVGLYYAHAVGNRSMLDRVKKN
ncbi:hypothetical protein CKO15_10245 [Halorhodospira abdelmalekii]|uniref:YdcF family protein n=1 Tax=Halorhodospira abdelmalekii TaxID=421629 RepID=UPI0019051BF9|nr:YdcF family protein [Halorhodospira abdelmalekii]MBK1735656.1 hypothetical protein [Halorhodospira abdelmalekii]